tara:strand:- start:105 stop:452 length:348 start_codon:yes stop_codon:yes gene_type:complete
MDDLLHVVPFFSSSAVPSSITPSLLLETKSTTLGDEIHIAEATAETHRVYISKGMIVKELVKPTIDSAFFEKEAIVMAPLSPHSFQKSLTRQLLQSLDMALEHDVSRHLVPLDCV